MTGGNFPPIITADSLIPQLYNDPISNPYLYPQENNFNEYFQNPLMVYGGQFDDDQLYGGQFPSDHMYSNQYYGDHSLNDRSPSPLISALVRQHIFESSDSQYERELLDPYSQYPYVIENYL
jgi:hypothetical protein